MRVLFVGNSYTFFHSMPQTFAALRGAEVDSVTKGGYSLAHYASEENEMGRLFREKLALGWDVVVLQEQSLRPSETPETFLASLSQLVPMIRSAGAEPVLYETWGRADGNEVLARHGWTHEEMQSRTRDAYERGAAAHGLRVVRAGDRLHEAYRRGEPVYEADGSHPSETGSRVIAEAFAETL